MFWLRHTPTLGPLGGIWEATELGGRGALQLLLHLPRGLDYAWPEQSGARNLIQLALLAATVALTDAAVARRCCRWVARAATTGFPLVSVPRFVVADVPLFMALAALLVERPRARTITLVAFGAVGGVACVAFSRFNWVA